MDEKVKAWVSLISSMMNQTNTTQGSEVLVKTAIRKDVQHALVSVGGSGLEAFRKGTEDKLKLDVPLYRFMTVYAKYLHMGNHENWGTVVDHLVKSNDFEEAWNIVWSKLRGTVKEHLGESKDTGYAVVLNVQTFVNVSESRVPSWTTMSDRRILVKEGLEKEAADKLAESIVDGSLVLALRETPTVRDTAIGIDVITNKAYKTIEESEDTEEKSIEEDNTDAVFFQNMIQKSGKAGETIDEAFMDYVLDIRRRSGIKESRFKSRVPSVHDLKKILESNTNEHTSPEDDSIDSWKMPVVDESWKKLARLKKGDLWTVEQNHHVLFAITQPDSMETIAYVGLEKRSNGYWSARNALSDAPGAARSIINWLLDNGYKIISDDIMSKDGERTFLSYAKSGRLYSINVDTGDQQKWDDSMTGGPMDPRTDTNKQERKNHHSVYWLLEGKEVFIKESKFGNPLGGEETSPSMNRYNFKKTHREIIFNEGYASDVSKSLSLERSQLEKAFDVTAVAIQKNPLSEASRVVRAVARKLYEDESVAEEIACHIVEETGLDLYDFSKLLRESTNETFSKAAHDWVSKRVEDLYPKHIKDKGEAFGRAWNEWESKHDK